MPRIFVYEGKEIPDPDPSMTPDDVRKSFIDFFPELANATVKPSVTRGEDEIIEFETRVGRKGEEHPLDS